MNGAPYQDDRCTRYDDPQQNTLVAELEDMVERWYAKADGYREKGLNADYHATRECADELAKTLEEWDA